MKDKNINQYLCYIVFFFFPLSFVLGNAAVNTLYFLISIYSLFIIFFKLDLDSLQKKILTLFCLILFLLVISTYNNIQNSEILFKSFFILRFIISLIGIYYIFSFINSKNNKYIKYFYIIILVFLSLDVLLQYFTGYNILNFRPGLCDNPGQLGPIITDQYANCTRFSGMFNDELVAGSYLSFFSWIGIFFLIDKKSKDKLIINFLIIFFLIIIILTGERSATLSYLVSLTTFYLLTNNLKENLKIFLSVSFVLAILSLFVPHVTDRFINYPLKNISGKISNPNQEKINIETLLDNPWGAHYRTSIEIFKNKPILGNGLKSFRYQCHKYQDIVKHERFSNCSTHPHNFYLEILIDTGIFGLTFFVFVIFLIFFDFFKKYKYKKTDIQRVIIFSLFVGFIFPFKPTGSIFSTWIGGLYFLLIGFYFFVSRKKNEMKF